MSEAETIVIFGASGDLTSRKLVPALFDNFRKKRLSERTSIVGVSRTEMSDDAFRDKLYEATRQTMGACCDADCWKQFAARIHYRRGDIHQADDYTRLATFLDELESHSGGGRLYYLSVAPGLYPDAVKQLGEAGLAAEDRGWRRIIIEKPFGRDSASAQKLNRGVHDVFREDQVYRIDHYLGKETVQNLLVFRFANTIFEPIWNRNYIDHVQITVAEDLVVGARGAYYEGAGVFRDMFQNHLLQVMTLIGMEPPARLEANALRDEKVKVLNSVRLPSVEDVAACSVIGQYAGYHNEADVASDSRTPTYAALRLYVDNWRWQGVPFYLRSAKGLTHKMTEVNIQFLRPPHMMFDGSPSQAIEGNRLAITIQPDEGIRLSFQSKVPDRGMTLRRSDLDFDYGTADSGGPVPDAYERLLLDALKGDASLFIRSDEIELAWRLIDRVIEAQGDAAIPMYRVGTWGPVEADSFIKRDGRSWINPKPDTPK